MTFLTILGVQEILCPFRLVLEDKIGKEIPESSTFELWEKFLENNFALPGVEDNTSGLLNRGDLRFIFVENTISNSPKVMRAKFLGSNRLFCFISICKFGSFKNPFATITSLSELCFSIRRIILLVHMKKVISMNYGSSTSSWKPWRWIMLDLIFSTKDIYINSNLNPLTKFSSSSRSTNFKDMLPWNISNDHKDHPNQH